MKNLVISVSPDSSLDLLRLYADVVLLDKAAVKEVNVACGTVYIRSHFGQPSTLPQNVRSEIDNLVRQAKDKNPQVKFIDDMDNVDAIVAFEDKWLQYKTFGDYMPRTELYDDSLDTSSFVRPVFKNRLSSRGNGVTWSKNNVDVSQGNWIVQETLDIQEELRVYVIRGEVYSFGAVKQSMTEANKAFGVNSRMLMPDEIRFSSTLMSLARSLDIVGIDIARTTDGELKLMEVNRSPGFAKFYELTGFNLAGELYGKLVTYEN